MKKISQGATEYLLILAVVLVIVGISIYFLTRTTPGGLAPTINVDLTDQSGIAADKVKMKVTKISTDVKMADWKYAVWEENESQPDWTDAADDLKVGTYELTIGGTETGADKTYNVWVYHVPTKSVMFKGAAAK